MRRVAIAAGGTGGHFYPGLVAARALKSRGWEPLMIVRSGDPALAVLEKEGLAALPVDLRGLPRRPGPELFSFAGKLVRSLGTLSRALRAFRPDLALGMGGYLTFPLVYAAWRRGVPRAVHESNALLGLANAASAKLGASVYWGMPPADPAARGTVVGTPIRPELWTRRDAAASRRELGLAADRRVVLVFGGSQGARAINAAVPEALKSVPGVQALHLAGKGRAEEAAAAYRAAGVDAVVREYQDDMAAAYGAADLVVCRSGASTLAELAAQRAPAVLVPYPHAAANHQDANARAFERAGAVVRIPEDALRDALGWVLSDLLKSEG
ncbi:MAG: UDP-N-acetylglucosamine--N-acetylmuramyl-(pentapeptide) pyrophosphoryl-undecaprenol N-acetylglucosamine transferase, partial [Elusimicrobia bacterium]|nr:UDP-N-acetylglucosamine--N-acetylmuramyl-(pentapeptide) pyrophosphoryl-undecaprenol N-acetylglucosamine transferase [Elusimicrobiota bacterium]